MEHSQFLRSEMLLGSESTNNLCESRVILFGLGGVGSYTAVSYTHLTLPTTPYV